MTPSPVAVIVLFVSVITPSSATNAAFMPFAQKSGPPIRSDHRHPNLKTCSSLSMGKNRARMEKNWEDMMGDDWRLFRARLVSQEQKYMENKEEEYSCPSSNSNFFASDDEILAFKDPGVGFDKHWWAHSLSHVEQGSVLVASEKLGGEFYQTVVLIIDHHDTTGTAGIIISRPYPGNLMKIGSETISNLDLSLKSAFDCAPVLYGGPEMQEDYSVLHGYGKLEGSKKVAPGVFIGGARELMDEVRSNNFDPQEALFVKGHAEWAPSQLSREVSQGLWYVASASPDLILRHAGAPMHEGNNPDSLWSDVAPIHEGNNPDSLWSDIAPIHEGNNQDSLWSDIAPMHEGYNPNSLWSDILSCMGEEHAEIAKRYTRRDDNRLMP